MTTLADIRRVMAAHRPQLISGDSKGRAAVAVILHEGATELQALFIERAERAGDPWSGHMAFPGGRVAARDQNFRLAAERETFEEIGLDLRSAEYLGRLDDLAGTTLPILVSGFVYRVEHPGHFELNCEVRDAFWIPLNDLTDSKRHVERRFQYRGEEHLLPAVDLLGPERPVLWGLTYRFVTQFLELLGHKIPKMP